MGALTPVIRGQEGLTYRMHSTKGRTAPEEAEPIRRLGHVLWFGRHHTCDRDRLVILRGEIAHLRQDRESKRMMSLEHGPVPLRSLDQFDCRNHVEVQICNRPGK